MKPVTKILIGILVLITLVPLRLGLSSWFDQSAMCEFFGFEGNTPDLDKLFVITGGFVLMLAIFQILAIFWIIKGKAEGFFMAALVGYTSILRGVITLALLGIESNIYIVISVIPIVVGLLIAILANWAREKEKLA